jgi:hypothetical protein
MDQLEADVPNGLSLTPPHETKLKSNLKVHIVFLIFIVNMTS